MEIAATLSRLEITSPEPAMLAAFHAKAFEMQIAHQDADFVCSGPGRELVFSKGAPGQLKRATYAFAAAGHLQSYLATLSARNVAFALDERAGYTVRDPEGRLISFVARPANEQDRGVEREARLQHFAVRTPKPAELAEFYAGCLGFIVSDRVLDDQGQLSAAFLRTDAEHHSLAIFRAPGVRFDHFSCEAAGWNHLRDWADHVAAVEVPLVWGVGRHGPGNDTFFMVRDADGNMGEISCDLEVCAPGRPAGTWPHRPSTLNRWGMAIMRS